jgi:hypothetical protein
MIEWINFYSLNFSQKEMAKKHTSDVVVHNMIEWIYFYSMIFSQKEIRSKKHTADVVVPDRIQARKSETRVGYLGYLPVSHHPPTLSCCGANMEV